MTTYTMNPPWVDRVLNRHWDKLVEAAPTRGGVPLLPEIATESAHGKMTFEEYGCGHYGCVMPTGDPDVVFKVSSDVSEAAFVAQVCQLGYQHPGVVRYFKIREIKGESHRKRRVFVLWRQEAEHVGQVSYGKFRSELVEKYGRRDLQEFEKDLKLFKLAASVIRDVVRKSRDVPLLLEEAAKLEDWAWDAARKYPPRRMSGAQKVALGRRRCEMHAEVMANTHICYLIGQAFEHYMDEGMILADVHLGNIGQAVPWGEDYSTPHLIITDPGHMVPLRQDRLKVLVPTLE